ncbi:MAG: hypothetical protein ABSE73_22790, partial [Planctomycetota bacterium]
MRKLLICFVPLVAVLAGRAFAQTTADIVLLAQKGVGEEVMVAFVEASSSSIQLSADDIVKLKDAKVPDKVIVALLRHRPAARQVAQERPAPVDNCQAPVVGRPVPEPAVVERERVVEVPSTTYVYDSSPYTYYSDWDYPYTYYGGWGYPYGCYGWGREYYGGGRFGGG